MLSGVGERFLRSLPRPRPENPPLLYVGLVFTTPKKVGVPAGPLPVQDAPVRKVKDSDVKKVTPAPEPETRHAPAKSGKTTVKQLEHPLAAEPPRPAEQPYMPYLPSISQAPLKPEPSKGPSRTADLSVPGNITAQEEAVRSHKTRALSSPHTVKEKTPVTPVKIDTEAADRKYVEFFAPREDTITVIKGEKQETLPEAKLPSPEIPQVEAPTLQPVEVEETPPNPVYEVYSSASSRKNAVEDYIRDIPDRGPTPLPEPAVLDTSQPSDAIEMAGETYPSLLGIRGVTSGRVQDVNQVTSAGIFGLLLEMMGGYAPSSTRPMPLFNGSLTTAALQAPAEAPHDVSLERIESPLSAPVSNKDASFAEPILREPPKIIEVEDYTEEPAEPPSITITRPEPGETDKSLVKVEGMVAGRGISSVLFSMKGAKKELLVTDGRFGTTVALEEGRNVLNAAAVDDSGRSARARVVVNYSPAHREPIISFISPQDGGIIDALYNKEMDITGTVNGEVTGTARVYLNKTIEIVPVVDGKFRMTRLMESEENTLYAEATMADGTTSRSDEIHFRVVNLFPKDITVLMETSGSTGVAMTHSWRPHPLSAEKWPDANGPAFNVSDTESGTVTEVEDAGSGIFTIGASYDIPSGETAEAVFRVTLYGYDPDRKTTRSLGPFRLKGRGRLKAVRVLLPERVFWEDDAWFSGMIESGSGTTKFRQPEGISWTEED